jgi:hypothetical protein
MVVDEYAGKSDPHRFVLLGYWCRFFSNWAFNLRELLFNRLS